MLLTCQFRSAVLRRNTAITVILPTPEKEKEPIAKDTNCPGKKRFV